MKGFKHKFIRLCKKHGVKITVGKLWQCHSDKGYLVVPEQTDDYTTFVGFHELAHWVLHSNDDRNYDDLLTRITIEREADDWANDTLRNCGYATNSNPGTLGLIALYLYQGNEYHHSFEIEVQDRFIVLKRFGTEVFSQFISNLPMHPCIY